MPSLANLSMRGVGIVPPYTPKAPQPMLSTKMKTMLGLPAVDRVAIEALLYSPSGDRSASDVERKPRRDLPASERKRPRSTVRSRGRRPIRGRQLLACNLEELRSGCLTTGDNCLFRNDSIVSSQAGWRTCPRQEIRQAARGRSGT